MSAEGLGYAGLLPFVLGALLVHVVTPEAHPYTVLILTAYAALIVSFLGGIVWGLYFVRQARGEDAHPRWLLWGVVPSLVAWPALVMPPNAGLVVLGVMLVACYLVDRRIYPHAGVAGWLKLRFRLSLIAALSCFLGAAGS